MANKNFSGYDLPISVHDKRKMHEPEKHGPWLASIARNWMFNDLNWKLSFGITGRHRKLNCVQFRFSHLKIVHLGEIGAC